MVKERVITVEHLVPSMSQELLCKFPDDSAFGFDYSQSQIWSPLIPRKKKKKKKKMVMQGIIKKRLEFSPIPTPKMGWKNLFKEATKRFRSRKLSAFQSILQINGV
ncbi:hypothetical protein KSP40_PGU001951 [Platanthera guangdongensis]|uniref:Uncharacterized protein n=1 Tax=Platanthera guangdongensis TaxID=2320717 RepID=A0ABR2LX49_9ASPA